MSIPPAQAKIFFARLCIYIGISVLIVQVILKIRESDRRAFIARLLVCSLVAFCLYTTPRLSGLEARL